jgi:hypothetical protein
MLTGFVARILFARFDAGGGSDPDDSDKGDEAKGHVRVLKGQRDRHEIDEEGEPVFTLDRFVLRLKLARVAQTAADGQTQEKKAEARQNHGCDIDGNREGVHLLFEDVGGEERQEREAEEEAEVGVKDEFVGFFGSVDKVVMIYPINRSKSKGDEIEAEGGENGAEACETFLVGDLELKHHDGDDDGNDSVGEGFKAGWGGDMMGHCELLSGLFRSG